jgi:hypothetical protein
VTEQHVVRRISGVISSWAHAAGLVTPSGTQTLNVTLSNAADST